jgi:creatinine amidohydrolase
VTKLAGLTSPEVADLAAAGALLAVPVASTEQHGPHLPLSTDTDLAEALCARLAAAWPGVLVGPPVAYGASGEHADFAGTLSIGTEALELLLVELGRSATRTFRRVLLVSTHGGNAEAVQRAEQRLRAESRDVRAWRPAWEGDAHAGRAETSIELALAPDRVRPGRAEAGNTAPLADLMPALRRSGVRAVSPNGVLGDPAGASAGEGTELLDRLLAGLLATVAAWDAEAALGAAAGAARDGRGARDAGGAGAARDGRGARDAGGAGAAWAGGAGRDAGDSGAARAGGAGRDAGDPGAGRGGGSGPDAEVSGTGRGGGAGRDADGPGGAWNGGGAEPGAELRRRA